MLASHLITTAAAQEPGQLRWQKSANGPGSLSTGRLIWHRTQSRLRANGRATHRPYIYASALLERMSASAAYRASAPRDVPVPTLDAASTRTSTRDPWPPAD